MRFTVVPLARRDNSQPVDRLVLPPLMASGPAIRHRKLSLNEADSEILDGIGPREALLGTLDQWGFPVPMLWADAITEEPRVNDTEIWELYNFTADAHPIHLHQVMFEVIRSRASKHRIRLAGESVGD
jgi:spore coat protein A, manganese oxidase